MKRLDTTTPPLQARREVAQKVTVESNFTVPALQASVIAVAVGIGFGILAIVIGIPAWLALIAALLVFVVTFAWRMDTIERAQPSIEEIWSAPPQQPQLPMPEKPPQDRVVLLNPPGQEQVKAKAQVKRDSDFELFIRDCGIDTTARYHAGYMKPATYQEYRDALIHSGHAKWRTTNRKDGWELIGEPEDIVRALA